MRVATKIFAGGALAKFLQARDRGASVEELNALKFAAAAEGRAPREAPSKPRRAKAADPVIELDAERARRAKEWDSIAN